MFKVIFCSSKNLEEILNQYRHGYRIISIVFTEINMDGYRNYTVVVQHIDGA